MLSDLAEVLSVMYSLYYNKTLYFLFMAVGREQLCSVLHLWVICTIGLFLSTQICLKDFVTFG